MAFSSFSTYRKAPFLSKKTVKDHLGLLAGYEENVSKLISKLRRIDREKVNPNDSQYRDLATALRHNYNAQVLHRIYFDQINDKPNRPTLKIKEHIKNLSNNNKAFKDFDSWKKDFFAAAKAAKGWVVFGYDPLEQCAKNIVIDGHDEGFPPAFFPILILDVWEHAYIGDFGTNREKYINKWFQHVKWEGVEGMILRWAPSYTAEDLEESVTASMKYRMVTLGIAKE